ncbi:hypothetical protein CC78DRAFT_51114 [Lojkania enalia]|uniref:DUF3074 domain-containing protein n=1 Tax=Lojkania enalia TaxID=147567 RepID=A0A9P4K1Y1_9PLEO|nr:hypothetical protein CC78DRAFT_51114 [Didymosphaeria enalia]
MFHRMPGPITHRVFTQLVISANNTKYVQNRKFPVQELYVVQFPMDVSTIPAPFLQSRSHVDNRDKFMVPTVHQASKFRNKCLVRGMYTSVENMYANNRRGELVWSMATASDARGRLPLWAQNRAIPSKIAKDVRFVLKYMVNIENRNEWDDSADKEEDASPDDPGSGDGPSSEGGPFGGGDASSDRPPSRDGPVSGSGQLGEDGPSSSRNGHSSGGPSSGIGFSSGERHSSATDPSLVEDSGYPGPSSSCEPLLGGGPSAQAGWSSNNDPLAGGSTPRAGPSTRQDPSRRPSEEVRSSGEATAKSGSTSGASGVWMKPGPPPKKAWAIRQAIREETWPGS